MKKILLLFLFITVFSNAQIVNIPDANFKAALLDYSPTIDTNGDGEIQESEAFPVTILQLFNLNIIDLVGIEKFINLTYIDCSQNSQLTNIDFSNNHQLNYINCNYNNLTSLDLTQNALLQTLYCRDNNLNNLNITGLSNLEVINCENNELSNLNLEGTNCQGIFCGQNPLQELNLQGQVNLSYLECSETLLETLDFSGCPLIEQLRCNYCVNLESVILKNGNFFSQLQCNNCQNLRYVCAREEDISYVQMMFFGCNCIVNSYCSFIPDGINNVLNGTAKLDLNEIGCNNIDFRPNSFKVIIDDGVNSGAAFSSNGEYLFYTRTGSYTLTPQFENNFFNVFPSSANLSFTIIDGSTQTQNFCITPNGVHNDVEVTIVPTSIARPGFDASYKLVYKNKGNQTLSGNVNFTFDDAVLDFVSSTQNADSQSTNNLSWNYTNLLPFESRTIDLVLNLNSLMETPPVNNGDVLNCSAIINPTESDETASDNTFNLSQTVVNSIDPNDKTCLEGNTISPDKVGEYVHYLIRFENTGTANAQNIVVKDMIDTTKFDVSTLIPVSASHDFKTRISNTNQVEFIFENIELPFDDTTNDGFVAFKIKTNPNLVLGNTFSNTASIYFDYNFPIETNTTVTTVQALSNSDFEFSNYFQLAPNPVKNTLNIQSKSDVDISSISIYNTLGQLVLVIPNVEKTASIDVSQLTSGTYFVKVISDKGMAMSKFIKE